MWFKNLKIYTLSHALDLDTEKLEEQLNEYVFRPCGSQDLATLGWASPLEQGNTLSHQANGMIWLNLKRQEKLLPASVVNAELADKVADIAAKTGNTPGKQAKTELKQEIIQRLLPRAFTKNSFVQGFISPKDQLVVIDASSDGKAELFLAHLRKAIGSLPVLPLCRESQENTLTSWLTEQPAKGFELLEEAELQATDEEAATIRCKNQLLTSEEIIQHIESGKLVQKLALNWEESCRFVLDKDLSVKRLKFYDVIKEQNDDIPKDQQTARIDADFALMSGEAIRLCHALTTTFNLDNRDSE